MKLHAITNDTAIFTSNAGQIIAQPITQGARAVLEWNAHHIPANQR